MRAISLFFAAALLAMTAHAQIYKCKDDKGQLLLSDKPCVSGELLQRKRTAEENYQDDVRAYEGQLNKYERRAREAQREYSRQAPATRYQQYAPPAVMPQHKGYDERLAERNAGVKSILDNPQPRQRGGRNGEDGTSIPIAPQPTIITNCNAGFCYDDQGGVYHRGGVS